MMEKVGKQLTGPDWEQIFQDFRGDDREKWLSQYPGLAILEQALYIVAKKEYPLKAQLLTFIEENTEVLIGEDDTEECLGSVVEALRMVLQAPADGLIVTHLLREQMMTTATVAMVVVDSLHKAVPQLEALVELLLGVINRPNHAVDRQARGIACECLRELEKNYPCLLHACAGHILFLFQSERTHVGQSYTLLITTILHNLACYMYNTPGSRSAGATSFLSTASSLVPFSVPAFLVTSEPGEEALSIPSRELTPIILREFRRVVGLLLERPQLLTSCGLLEFVSSLIDIAAALELQGSILKLQLYNLMYTYSPLLCHIVLMVFSRFTDAFDGEEAAIFKRLILLCNDPQQPLLIRLLAVHWLLGTENLCINKQKKSVLASMALSMYPLVYDPLSLKALKLDTLAYCAACVEPSGGSFQNISSSVLQISSSEKEEDASKLFKDGAVCVSAFRWLPSWSSETRLMFRMLHRFLTVEVPHSRLGVPDLAQFTNSTLFKTLEGRLVSLALHMRRLVPCVLALVDRLLLCKTHCNLGEYLLQTFNRDLLCQTAPDKHLPAYFPILERIAENGCIPPGALVELLTMYIRNQVADVVDEGWRLWIRGSQVLRICRTVIVHHRSSRVFHSLCSLLSFLCCYFPDIEVQDSARMYLRMLISVPGNRLRAILKYGDERIEDSSAPQLSSILRSPSPSHHGLKQSLQVASYIHLTRAIPLLVRQSWSLVLHNMFQTGSNVSTEDLGNSTSVPAVSSEETGVGADEQKPVELPYVEDISGITEPVLKDENEVPEVMDPKVPANVEVLRKYFSVIPDYRSGPGLKIKVHCYLRFQGELQPHKGEEDSPRSTISGPSFSDSWPALYAIVISFFTSGPYGRIPSVHIPFLLREPPKGSNQSASSKDLSVVQLQAEDAVQAISEIKGKKKLFTEDSLPGFADRRPPSVENGSASEEVLEEETFRESVIVELEPKQPVPTIIDSRIVTSDEDGRSMHGQLDSIHVGIEDLFVKAPVPPDVPPDAYPHYYLNLFNSLWEGCGARGRLGTETYLLRGGKEGIILEGTESVKLLESQADKVLDAVERYLASFVVTVSGNQLVSILKDSGVLQDVVWQEDGDTASSRAGHYAIAYGLPTEKKLEDPFVQSDQSQGYAEAGMTTEVLRDNLGCLCILIFLPPHFHLLFKMDVSDWSTLVQIRTDHWPCLAYVDEYLEALTMAR